jgi:sugar O-acyltransferase (sialic acid O-acetyltransferase NeuD family)
MGNAMTLPKVDLIIIGVGGNSLEVHERIKKENPDWSIRFLDDASNHPLVIGGLRQTAETHDSKKLFMIGSPKNFRSREELFLGLEIPMGEMSTYLDKNSWISDTASIGLGSVLMWNSYVGNSSLLGKYLMILPNVFIGHDTTIGDYTVIAANVAISGGVTIGKQCYIGANATIREGIIIGENALIGAGSVVITNVPSNSTFVGNPARNLPAQKHFK